MNKKSRKEGVKVKGHLKYTQKGVNKVRKSVRSKYINVS